MFPILLPTGEIRWNNSASIVITFPIDEENWLSSSLVSTTTGAAYNNLVQYLQEDANLYLNYQPITIFCVNESFIDTTNQSSYTTTLSSQNGEITTEPGNSLGFVTDLLDQLWLYGADLNSYLQLYATSFSYLQKQDYSSLGYDQNMQVCTVAPSIATDVASPERDEVYRWYSNLHACYERHYNNILSSNDDQAGGSTFLADVKGCYRNSSQAYVFKSNHYVYNVSLFQTYPPELILATPLYTRNTYVLPSDNAPNRERKSQPTDRHTELTPFLIPSYPPYRVDPLGRGGGGSCFVDDDNRCRLSHSPVLLRSQREATRVISGGEGRK